MSAAAHDLSAGVEREGVRPQLIEALRLAERVALYNMIILSPLRARFVIADRSNGPIYGDYVDFLLFWSDLAFIALLALWAVRSRIEPRKVWLAPLLVRVPVAGL